MTTTENYQIRMQLTASPAEDAYFPLHYLDVLSPSTANGTALAWIQQRNVATENSEICSVQ